MRGVTHHDLPSSEMDLINDTNSFGLLFLFSSDTRDSDLAEHLKGLTMGYVALFYIFFKSLMSKAQLMDIIPFPFHCLLSASQYSVRMYVCCGMQANAFIMCR